jgi:hypothetical protein
VIIILLSLAIGFIPGLANWVSDVTDKPVENITALARQSAMVAIGLFFIYAGALAAGSLILGGGLIAIGIVLVAVAVWPWFKKSKAAKD